MLDLLDPGKWEHFSVIWTLNLLALGGREYVSPLLKHRLEQKLAMAEGPCFWDLNYACFLKKLWNFHDPMKGYAYFVGAGWRDHEVFW